MFEVNILSHNIWRRTYGKLKSAMEGDMETVTGKGLFVLQNPVGPKGIAYFLERVAAMRQMRQRHLRRTFGDLRHQHCDVQ